MRVLLNVDATQCIAYSPEAKVARPNSATLGPPRVYEPKVMAKPTLSHTHLRIRLSPSPLVPRPSPFDPRCQTSKKLPSPPRVYVYEQKAHAISRRRIKFGRPSNKRDGERCPWRSGANQRRVCMSQRLQVR